MKNFLTKVAASAAGLFIVLGTLYLFDILPEIKIGGEKESVEKTSLIASAQAANKEPMEPKKKIELEPVNEKLITVLTRELEDRIVNFTAREGCLEAMNDIADAMHLPIVTERNIDSLKKAGFLVPITEFVKLKKVDPELAFCTKPLSDFLENLSIEFSEKFNKRLTLTSAIRTMEHQKKLAKKNKNAAKEEISMHVRGAAIDISYKNLSVKEITWLQKKFDSLKSDQRIYVIKERIGYHNFHIVAFL